MTFRELMAEAELADLKPGEVFEAHKCGDQVSPRGTTPVCRFIRKWAYAGPGIKHAAPNGRYLGLVHESGAALYRIDGPALP